MDEKTINSRNRLPNPAGYLVPLRDEGQLALSYVFAFTRWLRPDEVQDYLPSVSSFTGHGTPYRASEVIRLVLDKKGFQQLPENLFARKLLSSFDWQDGKPGEFLAAFAEKHGEDGYPISFSDFAVVLREGQRPDDGIGLPAGEGALWRDRRVTICIDLDGVLRNEALRALRSIVSDLGTASGTLGFELAILAGRAEKWDSVQGRFLTSEETLESYQQERIKALDQLVNTKFRSPVARQRWSFVSPRVRKRAEDQGHSESEELLQGVQRNLELVLCSLLSEEVERFSMDIVDSPPRPLPDWASDFDQFQQGLEQKVRAALNEVMTQDYLEDPNWRDAFGAESKRKEVALDLAREKNVSRDAVSGETDQSSIIAIDDVLANAFGRELAGRAHFTPKEKEVLAAIAEMGEGDSLADWARRNNMNPATANVHKCKAKKKLEKAKKLI